MVAVNWSISKSISHVREALRRYKGSVAAQIVRGASGASALSLFNIAATFATAVLLARFMGVKEYGIYSYVLSWVTLLGVFANLGLSPVMVRNVAVYHQEGDWARIRGMFRFSIFAVSVASVLCALAVAAVAWLLHKDSPEMRLALWLACLLLPLQALLMPFGSTQQGFRQVINAQIPSLLILPSIFLALVIGAHALSPETLLAGLSIVLRIAGLGTSLVAAIVLLRFGIRSAGRSTILPTPIYQPRTWLASAAPLVLMGSTFMINANADILMLGSITGPEAAGLYKAATRGAELLTFGLVVISVPLGPLLARLYAAGEIATLQRELSRWARVAFAPAAVLAVAFVIDGSWFLALFGSEFTGHEASAALAILAAGQLIHVAAGPAGLLLLMSGHERLAAQALAVGAVLNVALNALLIPTWGVRGAAVATACSTAIFALLLVVFAFRRLKLNPTVVPVRVNNIW